MKTYSGFYCFISHSIYFMVSDLVILMIMKQSIYISLKNRKHNICFWCIIRSKYNEGFDIILQDFGLLFHIIYTCYGMYDHIYIHSILRYDQRTVHFLLSSVRNEAVSFSALLSCSLSLLISSEDSFWISFIFFSVSSLSACALANCSFISSNDSFSWLAI